MRSEFSSNPQCLLAVVVRLEGSGIHNMKFYLRVALFCGVSRFAKNTEFLLVVFSGLFLPCLFCFVFVFMPPLELCRRSSDLFLPSRPRTYRIGTRSVNVNNTHNHTHTPDGNGDDDNGNKNRIGEGGREGEKRKKPQSSCRRRAGNGGDTGGNKKKCRKERVGSVAANPDYLGSNKEAGGGAQGAQGSSKICTSRESVSPLSRLIRGFRNKHH